MELIIAFIILVATIVIGVPVVYSFGLTSIWLVYSLGFDASFVYTTMYSKMNGVVLLAIPLFIILGGVMEKGGVGSALVEMVEAFIGRLKGALCFVASVACAVFGAICGSGAATLSCIGSILAPKMRDRKYPMGIAAAILACSAPIGMLIPPSSIQILIAWAGNLSVLRCFLATIIPGIILTILIGIVGVVLCKKYPDIVVTEKLPLNQWGGRAGKKTMRAIPALVMPLIVLGGIYGGVMTPTEAAGVAIVYAIPVSIYIYKGIKWRDLGKTFRESAVTTGVIMVMLGTIMVVSRILVMNNVPSLILDGLLAVTNNNKYLVLLMINIFLVIIGMLMDDVSGTLLTAPILLPIGIALGISPYQMAAIMGVNLGMGNVTPPTAPFLYLGARICKVDTKEMIKPMLLIILLAYLPTLLLTTYIPDMSLFLPNLLMGAE